VRFSTLDQWLKWQEHLHPRSIDLGLERVREVAARLDLLKFDALLVTLGGTNGKGSCSAMLESIYRAAGYRVGKYASPHLLHYGERIQYQGRTAAETEICQAFERVDTARRDISLTYFEFGTLAALEIFSRRDMDLLLLEVGLGGRLDAVNILDADVAVITSVGLDHQAWLGHDRETIGAEKAGILRRLRPVVYGGTEDPPQSLTKRAAALSAPLYCANRDFHYQRSGEGWDWRNGVRRIAGLPLPALRGQFQLANAATALQVMDLLQNRLPLERPAIDQGLSTVYLAGRYEVVPGPVETILDVAHNPDGAKVLAHELSLNKPRGRAFAVVGMLSDKSVETVVGPLEPLIQHWYAGGLPAPRGLAAQSLAKRIENALGGREVTVAGTVAQAYRRAMDRAQPGDRLVVFGSFRAVAQVLEGLTGTVAARQVDVAGFKL
jgi:dihydrofolate synthase/folylpolyglutamate synthase